MFSPTVTLAGPETCATGCDATVTHEVALELMPALSTTSKLTGKVPWVPATITKGAFMELEMFALE